MLWRIWLFHYTQHYVKFLIGGQCLSCDNYLWSHGCYIQDWICRCCKNTLSLYVMFEMLPKNRVREGRTKCMLEEFEEAHNNNNGSRGTKHRFIFSMHSTWEWEWEGVHYELALIAGRMRPYYQLTHLGPHPSPCLLKTQTMDVVQYFRGYM